MNINQTILEQALINIKDSLKEKNINDSYAFLLYSMMTILWVDMYEAIESVTEWWWDNNIDWFYIDQTNENIIVSIFQSKHRTNLDKSVAKNDIDLLVQSLDWIFWWNIPSIANEKLLNKIKDLKNIIAENWLSKKPIVNIYIVTNWKKPNLGDREKADNFKKERNNFEFRYYDTEDLLEIDSYQNKSDYKVRILSKWEVVKHTLWKVKSLILMISAESLIKLYEEGWKDKILDKNIRYFLWNNKINSKIKETAESQEDSQYFYCLNNWISIVCDYVEYQDDLNGNKIIEIENPNIVNWWQTTKSLYDLSKQSKIFGNTLNNVSVLTRIYETKNDELINKIVEWTNRQNPIFVRDIKSNDDIQKKVKKYFEEKWFYLEVKRNEYKTEKIDRSKIISNDRLLQAYISIFQGIPAQAYLSKWKVFENYFNVIFSNENENLAKKMFRSFELLNFIEKKWDYLESSLFSLLYILIKLNSNLENINLEVDYKLLETNYIKAKAIISSLVTNRQKDLWDKYSNNNLFKSWDLNSFIDIEIEK